MEQRLEAIHELINQLMSANDLGRKYTLASQLKGKIDTLILKLLDEDNEELTKKLRKRLGK